MVEMAVERSARRTTSTTTADTGPIAAVIVAPPTTIRTNWTTTPTDYTEGRHEQTGGEDRLPGRRH